ncbi:hypothetical protein KORDIASMS9_00872 [Kordia sp. SMS9]|uniref:hypothetical protein n=1 Tax=Kordia sp. SMS9 TaxID=2282170 RepID=UPI000E0D5F4D|nr:hypothetical protein [Kordia sp. SMS9]AXG68656.1 hypothetical protein KORDIASMS9_00872 [Kordia sp. SMS9]
MKKIILKPRHFILVFALLVGSLFTIGCQSEDVTNKDDIQIESTTSKRALDPNIPYEPDFTPPNIPNPPMIDEHCVVRLAYLSYSERCPENASVVNYWIGVLRSQRFEGLAVGFITAPGNLQRWDHRYRSFLHRNNITSHQISKTVYIAYRGLLLREPDVNGGAYWTNVERNVGLINVARGIGNSPEFGRRLSRISTECNNAANQCTF